MRFGFSTNSGIDVVITALVYTAAALVALLIREVARAGVGNQVGDRVPRLAGRSHPGREIFDPLGSVFFPLFMAAIGAISYAWAVPLSYDFSNLGSTRRVLMSALSGSVANLVTAAAAARLLSPLTQSVLAGRLLGAFVLANVAMAVMHLLPVPHLDGGRIVAVLLSPPARATFLRVEPWGIGIVLGLGLLVRYIDNWPFRSIISTLRRLIA